MVLFQTETVTGCSISHDWEKYKHSSHYVCSINVSLSLSHLLHITTMPTVDFLTLLDYVCGDELLLRQDEFLFYRMTLLPRVLLTTPTKLWSRSERVKACLTNCPTCGHEYKAVAATAVVASSSFANTHYHNNNCVFLEIIIRRRE